MRKEIDLTLMLDEESKEYIKIVKVVEEKGKLFLDFKFNSTMKMEQKILLADCIASNIIKEKELAEVFKDEIRIRILK